MTSRADRRGRGAACTSIVAFVLLAVATACTSTAAQSGTVPIACAANADCPSNEICSYDVHQGCSASGYCATKPTTACVAEYACNCSGASVPVCLVGGESPSPIEHLGTCDGGIPAAYLPDATVGMPVSEPDASDDASSE